MELPETRKRTLERIRPEVELEPPKLPAWRDTPQREAYWHELCASSDKTRLSRHGGLLYVLLYGLCAALLLIFAGSREFSSTAVLLAGALLPAVVLWALIMRLDLFRLKLKLAAKYGFYMRKLKRPDLSREIGAILAGRPVFDEESFRRLWSTDEQAETAAKLLKIGSRSWHFHGKMLYPADPLLFLFYGRTWRGGKDRMLVEQGDLTVFYEEVEDAFGFPDESWENMEPDAVTLAELTASCLAASKKRKS